MSITIADWEPSASKLPVYGQRIISSSDWKYIVYEIYERLNELKAAAACYADDSAPENPYTGMLWLDTTSTVTPILKLYVVDKWFIVPLTPAS